MMSERTLAEKIDRVNLWINEGRNFPNNYRNIQMISDSAADLITDLVNEREKLIAENQRLRNKLKVK